MRTLIYISCFVLFANLSYAQKDDKHERIEALKTAYFTQQLELTSEQAQRFWPIYNNYSQEMHALKTLEHEVKRVYKSDDELTTAVAQKTLSDLQTYYSKKESLKHKLIDDLLVAFDPVFVVRFKKADYMFRLELLKKYRDKD